MFTILIFVLAIVAALFIGSYFTFKAFEPAAKVKEYFKFLKGLITKNKGE